MAAFQKFQFDNFIIDEDNRLQTLPLPEEEPQAEPETVEAERIIPEAEVILSLIHI